MAAVKRRLGNRWDFSRRRRWLRRGGAGNAIVTTTDNLSGSLFVPGPVIDSFQEANTRMITATGGVWGRRQRR